LRCISEGRGTALGARLLGAAPTGETRKSPTG